MTVLADDLIAMFRDWLPQQRWYAGKGLEIGEISLASLVELPEAADARLIHTVIRISYPDGGVEHYQVPLGVRSELPERLHHAALGHLGDGHVYDALHDNAVMAVVLRLLAEAGTGTREIEGLLFSGTGEQLDISQQSLVIGAEQSNTSVVYGEEYVLKVFRRLSPGTNPDLEITRALADGGCKHVIPPFGWIEGTLLDVVTTLAVLQPYLRSASEGWALAVTSVRDLYAEADLHADEVGGDFAAEAERLGHATAEVHADLARALPTAPASRDDLATLAARMHERLDVATAVVPDVVQYEPELRQAFDALAKYSKPVTFQRIHGDFHLGQALRTDFGWVLLDFEGEPAKPLAERTAPDSPLRDVAGVLRSFDYAARHLLATMPPQSTSLGYRAVEWAERNAEAFCDGYAAASGRDPRGEPVLLRGYLLDKVIYEVMYEARHRPTWLPVPLGSLERLVGKAS